MTSFGLPSRIATLMIASIIVFVAVLSLALLSIRFHLDRTEEENSFNLVTELIARRLQDIAKTNTDYSLWTNAWQAVDAQDWRWVYESYLMSESNSAKIDGVILLGGSLDSPVSWIPGGPVVPQASYLSLANLQLITARLEEAEQNGDTFFSTILKQDGKLVMLSAPRIRPADPALIEGQAVNTLAIAVFRASLAKLPLRNLWLKRRSAIFALCRTSPRPARRFV